VEDNIYQKPASIKHTHEGSIGNLSNSGIVELMDKTISQFPFQNIRQALSNLVN
jgi:argininosuccinate lyase